jgi:hypothetical protein
VTLFLQVGSDVIRQLTFAVLVGLAWEWEKSIAWWNQSGHPTAEEIALLIAGLAAGGISAFVWPRGYTAEPGFFEIGTLVSPVITGIIMTVVGMLIRRLGKTPLSFFAMRPATIVALGISLSRALMLTRDSI